MYYNSDFQKKSFVNPKKINILTKVEDYQIGIFIFWAFRSIFGILQYFSSSLYNLIQKFHFVGIIYAITMLYMIIKAIPKIKKSVWIMFFLLFISFLISSFNNDNYEYIKKIILGDFITTTIPLIAIVSIENDPDKMLKCMRFSSYFVLINSLFIPITPVYKNGEYSYMYLAYSSLVPWATICYYSFKDKNILDIIFTIITAVNFFLFGSRGAILCMIGFILIYILIFYKNRKRYYLLICLIIFSLFIKNNFFNIINWFVIKLYKYNLQSRTLRILLENQFTDSSGRDYIFYKLIKAIENNPFGYGIGFDRVINGGIGDYAHNMFLELIIDFGVILGGAICVGIILMYIYMLFKCDDLNYKALFCIFSVPGFIMLMMSGSIYENYEILVSFTIFNNYIYKKRKIMKYEFYKERNYEYEIY